MSKHIAKAKINEFKRTEASKLNLSQTGLNDESLFSVWRDIIQLEALTELDLSRNQLSRPVFLGEKTRLKALDLSGNRLTDVSFISKLRDLVSLKLRSVNNFTTLLTLDLSFLFNLRKLESLDLSGNKLGEFSKITYLKKNLTYLDLKNAKVSDISDIAELENLTHLDLRDNRLFDISHLKKLTKLSHLFLSGNSKIKKWDFFRRRNALTRLSLSNNNLFDASFVGELHELTHLSMRRNQLYDFSFLKNLKKLVYLDLTGNEYIESLVPEEILNDKSKPLRIISTYFGIEDSIYQTLKDTPEKLWKFIEDKTKKPTELRALLECRLVIVGPGNAGKTSLSQRLLYPEKDELEDKGKTEGVEIDGKEFEIRGQKVWINIWDFGGQEVYHSTHKFFYRARCLYVLVVDVRASTEKFLVKYWLRQIKELAKSNAPLIIVANKAETKEEPKQIDKMYQFRFEEQIDEFKEIYPNIKAVHYVSTNTPLNTNKVKQEVIEAIDKDLKDVWETYPAYYAETRERFKARKDGSSKFGDFISKEEFENELSEEAKKDDKVVEILDVLGVFCHFKKNEDDNDDELEKMYVLNPEWITKGVYKILSSYILAEKKGKVTHADIKTILNKSVYEEKHNYIIKLMRRFKLCFVKNYQDKDFVIFPTWLPITETSYSPFIANISRFEYKYESETELEKAITNFIVDAQSNSNDEQDTYWRRGIVIRNNQLRSLVKADLETEILAITVEGEQTERNKKLAEIKSYFAKFHRENEIKVTDILFDEIGKVKDIIASSTSPDKHLLNQIPKLENKLRESQNKIENLRPLKQAVELYEKILPLEKDKSKIEGFADERTVTYEKFVISILIVLSIGWVLFYFENKSWFETTFSSVEPFGFWVLPIILFVLGLSFYAWKRNWFSMEDLPNVLKNKILKNLHSKNVELLKNHTVSSNELESLKPKIEEAKKELEG